MRLPFAGTLILATAAAGAAGAQAPPLAGGGPGSDVGQAVAMLHDRMAVVGEFEQTAMFGSVSVTSADAPAARSDVFVAMYNRFTAEVYWARRMGTGVFNDFAGGVAFDNGNNVYVAGYFTGVATWDGGANPDVTITTRSDFDGFLAKYSATGDLAWVQQIGGTDQDVARGVVTDEDDNVYVAGSFYGTATWGDARGDTTITSLGSNDGYVAKYASDGALQWVLRVGGTDGDEGRALDYRQGELYAAGTFRGVALFGAVPLSSRGFSDIFVARLDEAGAVVWAQQVGGAGFDYGRGVAVGPYVSSDVRVAGSFEESILLGNTVLTSAGNSDAVTARIDVDTGALLDGVRIGGTGFDIANAITSDDGTAFATVGYLEGPVTVTTPAGHGPPIPGAGGVDAFAYVQGSWVYEADTLFVLGGPNADRGYGAAGYFNEYVAVTGTFRDTADFDGAPLVSVGGNDVFLFTAMTGCGACPATEPGPAGAVALGPPAPNPAAGRASIAVTLDRPRALRVELFDALGRRAALLHEGPLPAGRSVLALDAGGLAAGAYVLRAVGEGVAVSRRLAVR